MYNSVTELHIGIDIALQNINSSRKQIIKPEEKDWVLNEVMYQLINSVANPNPRLSRDYFEIDQKAIDMLEVLKVNDHPYVPFVKSKSKYGYGYAYQPKGYLRATEIKAAKVPVAATSTEQTITCYKVPIPDAGLTGYTEAFDITLGGVDVFDVTDTIGSKKIYNFDAIKKQDSKYLVINAAITALNSFKGISAYWTKFGDVSNPFSIIVFVDHGNLDIALNGILTTSNLSLSLAGTDYEITPTTVGVYDKYNDSDITLTTCRIVKSDIEGSIEDHYYAKSAIGSPVVTFGNNTLKVKLPTDSRFKIVALIPEYYRKPLPINYKLNQGCEILNPDFINELVNKTAQKIAARIQDKSYPNIINENALLE